MYNEPLTRHKSRTAERSKALPSDLEDSSSQASSSRRATLHVDDEGYCNAFRMVNIEGTINMLSHSMIDVLVIFK